MQAVFDGVPFSLPTPRPDWVENFKDCAISLNSGVGMMIANMRLAKCGETGIRVAGIPGDDRVCFSIKEVGKDFLDVAMYWGVTPEEVAKAISKRDNYYDADYKSYPYDTTALSLRLVQWYYQTHG